MSLYGDVPLVWVGFQPAGNDEPLRMYALDRNGWLWTRKKGSAGWGVWRRGYNPMHCDHHIIPDPTDDRL